MFFNEAVLPLVKHRMPPEQGSSVHAQGRGSPAAVARLLPAVRGGGKTELVSNSLGNAKLKHRTAAQLRFQAEKQKSRAGAQGTNLGPGPPPRHIPPSIRQQSHAAMTAAQLRFQTLVNWTGEMKSRNASSSEPGP